MRILFFSHRIPYPPNKGDKLRDFNIIKYLSKKHEVSLVSLYDDKLDSRWQKELQEMCSEVHLFYIHPRLAKIRALFYLLGSRSATLGYFYSHKMTVKLRHLLQAGNYDLLFVSSSSMAQYVMDCKTKKVIDFVDCDSAKWSKFSKASTFPSSWVYAREHVLLKEYEKKIVQTFDHLLTVSSNEIEEFGKFTETENFTVVTNGVNTSYFNAAGKDQRKRLVFNGTMDYFVCVDAMHYFCSEIFPEINKRVPEVELYIVGRNPLPSIQSLAQKKGVFVTGYVDDVREYLNDSSISVIPLRVVQGLQNKILEAMASGLPVVTTSKAIAGLNVTVGTDLLVADDPEEFALKVSELLENTEQRISLGKNARNYVKEHHNWERNLSVLDEII